MHEKHEDHHRPKNGSPRIPLALQNVFLNGNRGIEVNTPPPDKSAMTTFRRSWLWWGRSKPSEIGALKGAKARKVGPKVVDTQVEDAQVITSPRRKKKKPTPLPTLSPQQYLDAMVRTRGYSAATYSTLSSAYRNKPTPYQLASYGVYTIDLIRKSDTDRLKQALELGLSPNACNSHGESILHNVCRRCDVDVLNVLLQAGCEIQVSDDNGRTPLHDACWAPEPNFPLVEKLLELDIRLLYMADSHGHLPLSYTRQDHWSQWLQFLQSKKDEYWPRNSDVDCTAAPVLTTMEPNSKPIPDPENALPMQIATMFAGGKIKPSEVDILKLLEDESSSDDDDDDSDYDDDDDDSDDDDDESDSTDSSNNDDTSEGGYTEPETSVAAEFEASWDVKEMNDVLKSLGSNLNRPLVW